MEKNLYDAKEPFNHEWAFQEIRNAVKSYPKAAMFQLADEGFTSVFEQLVSCILSIRTLDEVSLPVARSLFSTFRTPRQIAHASVEELDELIQKTTFHFGKAQQIQEIAKRTLKEFDGVTPADEAVLRSFKGVGPKCANLVLGIAGHQFKISVDTHVHRVTNRWGILSTKNPEKTLVQLENVLPKKFWVSINELLVPFGKHICTYQKPKCSTCPVLSMCLQVGVRNHR